MASPNNSLTPAAALADFAKRMPKTVRAMKTGEGIFRGTRGAGFWFAFAKARGAEPAKVDATEPKR